MSKPVMKCCMKGCIAEGEPDEGLDFFCCDDCLDELGRLLQQAHLKRLQRHEDN